MRSLSELTPKRIGCHFCQHPSRQIAEQAKNSLNTIDRAPSEVHSVHLPLPRLSSRRKATPENCL
jgi:hypothetical protein